MKLSQDIKWINILLVYYMGFFNQLFPKTKDVVWTLPADIKYYPSLYARDIMASHAGITFAIKFIIFYILVWGMAAQRYMSPNIYEPIGVSFITGLIFLIGYGLWENRSFDLIYNKHTHNMVYSTSNEYYKILQKSPYNPPNNSGAMVKKKDYDKLKKEGEIKSTDYKSPDQQMGKLDVLIDTDFVNLTFQTMIIIFSLGILATYLKRKVFEHVWPWLVLSVVFSFIQAAAPFWTGNSEQDMYLFAVKKRLFIIGLSFCLATVLIVLKINNR